jgi:hypothetical protein
VSEFIGRYYGLIELVGVYGLLLVFLGREAWRYRPSKLREWREAEEAAAREKGDTPDKK